LRLRLQSLLVCEVDGLKVGFGILVKEPGILVKEPLNFFAYRPVSSSVYVNC
jgi:hypothetical protein